MQQIVLYQLSYNSAACRSAELLEERIRNVCSHTPTGQKSTGVMCEQFSNKSFSCSVWEGHLCNFTNKFSEWILHIREARSALRDASLPRAEALL